jgi:hypothetical protein
MSSSRELVAEQFPHLRDRVVDLFDRDLVFREMCEDYEACRQALFRAPAEGALNKEYAALQLRLEFELLRYVSHDANRAGDGPAGPRERK